MTWDVPTKDNCPECGKTLFKRSGRGRSKPFCINPECPSYLPPEQRGYKPRKSAGDGEKAEDGEKKPAAAGAPAKKSAAKKAAPAKKPAAKKTAAKKPAARRTAKKAAGEEE